MYSSYTNGSNSSVETLNPLVEPPKKYNIIPNNYKESLFQTKSNPISINDEPPKIQLAEDLANELLHLSKYQSNISQHDNIYEFSQLWEFYGNHEANATIDQLPIETKNEVSNVKNEKTTSISNSEFSYSRDAIMIIEERKKMYDIHIGESISNVYERNSAKRILKDLDDTNDEELRTFSPQESAIALTTSDFISPIPVLAFSPKSKSDSIQKYKLQKVLQELLDSEENYVVSLTLLLNYYIDPLVNDNINRCGLPLIAIKDLLSRLIVKHTNMLQQLRLLYQYPWNQPNESSMIHVATEFAKTVFEVGIDIPIYEEYCNIYENVLKLIKDSDYLNSKYKKDSNQAWVKGWKNYLEATQPISKRMDLSFLSLVQKPISRVAKYRLIIESLLKYSYANNAIYIYCNLIKSKLNELNDKSQNFKDNDTSFIVNNFLNFECISLGVKLSLEFFGKCLMIGSLTVVWVEADNEKSSTMGAFLYKSHLILSDISTRKIKKNDIKFIIPLSICNLFSDPKECAGGLYSKYSYNMKLIFEYQFCQYEILIIAITKTEQHVWNDFLDTLINHVNGPCTLDYTNSSTDNIKLIILYPENIIPYDISLLKVSNYRKFNDYCYFKTPIFLNIVIEFPTFQETTEKGYVLIEKGKDYYPKVYAHTISIFITKIERANAELNLASIWSKELPLIFPNKQENATKAAIKKSSSWSLLKMGMGSFRGLRTSQSFSEGINSLSIHPQYNTEHSTDHEFSRLDRQDSRKCDGDAFDSDKIITSEFTDSQIRRINSKSYKFKNAVLGLFQISRSSSINIATD